MLPVLNTICRHRYDVSMKRLNICQACEFYDSYISKCKKCGCFMNFKTILMDQSCPIEKWGPEEDKTPCLDQNSQI